MQTGVRHASIPADCMVFCDFDGTITERDTLQAVCQEFIPGVAARLLPAIGRGEITLSAGVRELINNIPSAAVADIRDFVCRESLRRGFEHFVRQLRDWDMPLVVLSGGMGFCVEARLQPWRHLLHGVHALDIDCSQSFLSTRRHEDSGNEAVPKSAIMMAYGAGYNIVIGDSFSDQSMAMSADRVFARDRLLSFMRHRNKTVESFRDFEDILAALRPGSVRDHDQITAALQVNQ